MKIVSPQIILQNANGTYDVTGICSSVAWSGDADNVCREVKLEVVVSPYDKNVSTVFFPTGGAITMVYAGKSRFIGHIVSKSKSTDSQTMTVTCYDDGWYLKRSKATRKYDGTFPAEITTALCKTYGIQMGTIAEPSVPIRRKFSGAALYSIIDTVYSLASEKTGEKYLLRFDGKQLNIIPWNVTPDSLILSPKTNISTAAYSEDVKDMINRVIIYDSDGNFVKSVSDDEAVERFGLLADNVKQGDDEDKTDEAKKTLEDNGIERRVSLSVLGNPSLITGNTVWVHEPYTGLSNTMWIDSDTHRWENGVYMAKITLVYKNEMRDGNAGQELEDEK